MLLSVFSQHNSKGNNGKYLFLLCLKGISNNFKEIHTEILVFYRIYNYVSNYLCVIKAFVLKLNVIC